MAQKGCIAGALAHLEDNVFRYRIMGAKKEKQQNVQLDRSKQASNNIEFSCLWSTSNTREKTKEDWWKVRNKWMKVEDVRHE